MSRRNSGRSTTGEPAVPYYLGTPFQEAVKHLRLTARRVLDERATFADLSEAWSIVQAEYDVLNARAGKSGGGR